MARLGLESQRVCCSSLPTAVEGASQFVSRFQGRDCCTYRNKLKAYTAEGLVGASDRVTFLCEPGLELSVKNAGRTGSIGWAEKLMPFTQLGRGCAVDESFLYVRCEKPPRVQSGLPQRRLVSCRFHDRPVGRALRCLFAVVASTLSDAR